MWKYQTVVFKCAEWQSPDTPPTSPLQLLASPLPRQMVDSKPKSHTSGAVSRKAGWGGRNKPELLLPLPHWFFSLPEWCPRFSWAQSDTKSEIGKDSEGTRIPWSPEWFHPGALEDHLANGFVLVLPGFCLSSLAICFFFLLWIVTQLYLAYHISSDQRISKPSY